MFSGLQQRVRSQSEPVRASTQQVSNVGFRAARSHHFGEAVTNLVSEAGMCGFHAEFAVFPSSATAASAAAIPTVHGAVQPRSFFRRSFTTHPAAAADRTSSERNSLMMSSSSFLRSVGVAAMAAAFAIYSVFAQAGPVSALSNPFSATASANNTVIGSDQFALGFITGTNPDFLSLASVTLQLATSGTTLTSSPIIELYSGVSAPSSLVGGLTTAGPLTSAEAINVTFTPASSPLALTASTTYWIVARAASNDAYSWYFSDVGQPTAQNGADWTLPINPGQKSTDSGSSYNANFLTGNSTVNVQVATVPEPSTLVMAGVGLLGLSMVARSRRRRTAAAEAVEADDYLG